MDKNSQELMERFMQWQWLLSRYFHRNLRAHGSRGVPYSGQGRVLKLLKMKPEIAQKELAEILGMRSQSIGELLSKLEKKGYITRTPSPGDKRVIIVHLTEKGINADSDEAEQTDSLDLFHCLSEQERITLKDYLDRLIANLEDLYGGKSAGRRRHCHGFPDFSENQNGNPDGVNFDRARMHDHFFHM